MDNKKSEMEILNKRIRAACASAFPDARAVCGEGPVPSPLMVIGEAPGRDETKAGRPFVGKGGSFFIEVFERASGLKRDEVYISNAVKVWPTLATQRKKTRKPLRAEQELFLPFLMEEIRIVDPVVILAVGKTAFSSLLPEEPFEAGKWTSFKERSVMAVYHPSYLLRRQKSLAESARELELAIIEVAAKIKGR
ncbi:Type-4 uracil-DNA glycosylase [uncultured bacterium]|nr:Type-4 uracil-DNA glycosylase [uncultured bacterium]